VHPRTITVTGSLLVLALLISGCGSGTDQPKITPDNSADVCTTFWGVLDKHNAPTDPAGVALDKALKENPGHADASAVASARAMWFQAVADDLHAVAGTANRPALKSALTRAADSFDRNAAVPVPEQSTDPYAGLQPVVALCPQTEPSADPVDGN
jgi:hypothetical protein